MLAAGCWLATCYLLVCYPLVAGCWPTDWLLAAGCWPAIRYLLSHCLLPLRAAHLLTYLLGHYSLPICPGVKVAVEWEELELTCCISKTSLEDPAKGTYCTHRSRCNFNHLKDYVSRQNKCPIYGCEAPMLRSYDVQRDDMLREKLVDVVGLPTIWLRGDEVSVDKPM